ncbi:00978b85-60bf-4ae8-bf6a-ec91b4ab1e7a-CDS [Sclerotinia trifoliorum]|uniref:00978b85-60bf-4ae8-bf6a-ec91b4ab1e7a-CDS n=1 Tax=Sclerotinia trifoliorum TaxID=28548 RepID=A0A8H2VPT2_9HELO|nr:00978b85-60bf-4ae8-bf6a-ec91b4ab1e7a-CDS [Sclerotinia trifoliorum]
MIGITVADFLGGLSLGWWKRNHNIHHIVTNSPEHDPDIEHMPFFAISHRFFSSLYSTYYDRYMKFDAASRFFIRYQQYFYYPILLLGRFNLYILAWTYLLNPVQAPRKGPAWWHRYFEIAGQIFFWFWFGYYTLYLCIPNWTSRFTFLLISHTVTAPLHVQLTLSHFAMSTSDLGVSESFAQKMVRTTMDVDCPPWMDFLHGGLQFQVVHHLFPRLPRYNLRKAQMYVRVFCEDLGVPYVRFGFVGANREVIGKLGDVAEQLRVLEECRKVASRNLMGMSSKG